VSHLAWTNTLNATPTTDSRATRSRGVALARRSRNWPSFALPLDRGVVTAQHVMAAPAGTERDQAIDAWCAAVWASFVDSHEGIETLLQKHAILDVGEIERNKP